MATPETPELDRIYNGMKATAKKYYNEPNLFVRDIFSAEPTRQQAEVLQSLATDKKVSVRAGHGVGKSTLASWAIYWFLLTRPFPKIICTAPTFFLLTDVLWAEAASWRQKSELITELFDWKQRRIEFKPSPANWWAAARTASKSESLTGRHAGHFLLIVDEASGVDDDVFTGAEGMLTNENSYVLLIGNPTRNAGFFYDSHNKHSKIWATHHMSCIECAEDWIPGSPLTGPTYVKEMEFKHGYDSNTFRIRVLGEFPTDEQDTLIPHNWVVDAINREVAVDAKFDPLLFGIDVGAGGDHSVIIHRRGAKIEKIQTYNDKNTMNLIGWVGKQVLEYKPEAIFIDPIGIGKGAYDRLTELNFKVYPVDVRAKARKRGFKRLRDELWWTTRTQFEQGTISIPDDDELVKELSQVKYKIESDGSVKVESKREMRSRGLPSTDRSDAINHSYYIDDRVFSDNTDFKFEQPDPNQPELVQTGGWMTA